MGYEFPMVHNQRLWRSSFCFVKWRSSSTLSMERFERFAFGGFGGLKACGIKYDGGKE